MPHSTSSAPRAVFWLQVASLAATAWVIAKTGFFPFGAQNYLPEGIAIALWFSFLALAVSGLLTFLLLFAMRRMERVDALDVSFRTSAAGAWFAPAVILLAAQSPLADMAALVLVVSVTRVLYSQWRAAPRPDTPAPAGDPPRCALTGELPHGFLPSDFWPAFLSAAALQAGFVFGRLERPSLSSVCYAAGAAVLTAYSIAAGSWTRDLKPALPRSILGVAVTLMLTALITITGMRLYGGGAGGSGEADGVASSKVPPRRHGAPPQPTPARSAKFEPPPIDPARLGPRVSVPGGVPGIILWPETKAVPLLVEPLPSGGLSHREASRPFVIPFAGAYWMFRTGFTRPPANSIVQRGTPTTSSFKTVDMWPLEMEAHQRLDRELDLSCCRQINIEVLNADKHPATITLELAMIDHAGPPIRFGSAAIRSLPDLTQDPIIPVAETLEFQVPLNAAMFDEFDVIFHRDRSRIDRSARISIQRFVLVPR